MGFFNRIRPDPGFVSPVRSDPGFVSPIRSDPIRSDPAFVNGHVIFRDMSTSGPSGIHFCHAAQKYCLKSTGLFF